MSKNQGVYTALKPAVNNVSDHIKFQVEQELWHTLCVNTIPT